MDINVNTNKKNTNVVDVSEDVANKEFYKDLLMEQQEQM